MSEERQNSIADAQPQRRLPAMTGLALLIALVAGGGWYGYQRATGTAGIHRVAYEDFVRDGVGAPRRNIARTPGVTVLPNVVRANADGGVALIANARNNNWQIRLTGTRGAAPDPASVELLMQTRRLLESRRQQADLKLTDAQKAALAAVPDHPPEWSPEQAKRATALLDALKKIPPNDAAGGPAKAELLTIVAAAARADRNAVAAAYTARAQQVRSILSAEQVKSLAANVSPAPKADTAKPAAKPAAKSTT